MKKKITYPENYLGAIIENYGAPFDGLLVRLEGVNFVDNVVSENVYNRINHATYNYILGVIEPPYDNTDNRLGLKGLSKKSMKQALDIWLETNELKPVNKASKALIKALAVIYKIR